MIQLTKDNKLLEERNAQLTTEKDSSFDDLTVKHKAQLELKDQEIMILKHKLDQKETESRYSDQSSLKKTMEFDKINSLLE